MNTHGLFEKAVSALVLLAAATELRGATTDLANSPLVTYSSATVKPNVLFVLDDSGSMGWEYMPDWAQTDWEYLLRNSDYNGIAYNPAINYVPPVKYKADGTLDTATYPSQTAANTKNWSTVKSDGYGIQLNLSCPDGSIGAVCDLALALLPGSGPRYYLFKAGEYCKDRDLTVCNAQSAPDATYPYAAPLRWCKTTTDAEAAAPADYQCRAARIESGGTSANTFDKARHPKPPIIRLTFAGSKNATLSTISIGTIPILAVGTSLSANKASTMAQFVADAINANSVATGLAAISSSNVVDIAQLNVNALATVGPITSDTEVVTKILGGITATSEVRLSKVPGQVLRVQLDPNNNSYPYPGTAAKAQSRLDCAGTTCTYAEEMTNFANWWAYYRTRMQMMKSATSRAFAPISANTRVGYLSINNSTGKDFLNIKDYTVTNKNDWYTKLFNAKPNSTTPLRRALSKAGRMYGGMLNGQTLNGATVVDPMQYSCQQNFTILSTDGYWNEDEPGGYQLDGSTAVGDQDGTEVRPMLDGVKASDTLADVAQYYYITDLRPVGGSACTGTPVPPATVGNLLCPASGQDDDYNNVPIGSTDTAKWQHMTTFTLGLGASGYMLYDPSYETATKGDFFSVKKGITADPDHGVCVWQASGSGACNWPKPKSNEQPNIDDLWHASINGRGSYFSAGDPAELVVGLTDTLESISRRLGASAAAITSNANITADDKLVFSTTFTTGEWSSQVIRQRFTDINTGKVPDYDPGKEAGTYPTDDYNYDWTAQVKLDAKSFGTRQIWTSDSNGNALRFEWASLKAAGETQHFEAGHISQLAVPPAPAYLSQFCTGDVICLPAAKQKDSADGSTATGQPLVDFLRGDRSNEGTLTDTSKYYRPRRHVLGDIVNAETVYVQKPLFSYLDPGYADGPVNSFVALKANRAATLYAAANDGMLHAFNAGDAAAGGGEESWAYIPRLVLPKLYKLADKKYATQHQFLVDATPVMGDICPNQTYPHTCTGNQWKTLMVGGLGRGGRGFYALDITDPSAPPKPRWEFGVGNDANMGYSYGNPIITKLKSGRWVVLVTSGYNNVPNADGATGDGKGYLYILDAWDGTLIRKISTGVGDVATPSGLARISTWVQNGAENNTAFRVYGGDLRGNLWRFDINGDIAPDGYEAQLLTTFSTTDNAGNVKPQPITAKPELTEVDGIPVVYVGTGRFLGPSDLNDLSQQSFYAVKDPVNSEKPNAGLPYPNPRDKVCAAKALADCFVKQTETYDTCPADIPASICSAGEAVLKSSNNPVDFSIGYGWFIDLSETGERADSDPALVFGTLVFNTNVPEDVACTGGGHSNQYFVDYRTGGAVWAGISAINASKLGNALGSRPVLVGLPNNTIISVTQMGSGGKSIKPRPISPTLNAAQRASWRELITE